MAGFTPEQVFTGEYIYLAVMRQNALDQAYTAHPERFIKGPPTVLMPSDNVCINPVPEDAPKEVIERGVNFSTLTRVTRNAI